MIDLIESLSTGLDCLPAEAPQLLTLNLGSGRAIPLAITERRPGDAAISVADPSQATERLG